MNDAFEPHPGVSVRVLGSSDVDLLRAMLVLFGEAFDDASSYLVGTREEVLHFDLAPLPRRSG